MSNPFSTRFVRPGAIGYIFPAGVTAASLVERLRQRGWRGAIVGPHGCGKSTLLAALKPAIEQAGRVVQVVALHDGQRRMPADFAWPDRSQLLGIVVVDGYEQLGWWARWRLRRACRRSGWGLLVTVHASRAHRGLPEIYRVQPSREVFREVVQQLLASQTASISQDDIDTAYAAHPDNPREALFALYDLIEERRSR
jgi:hypothetical protein